jgi:hypothetical protein
MAHRRLDSGTKFSYPEVTTLGVEGFVASSKRSAALRKTGSYALSGAANSTSGTLYACYHLLRACGVRFLAWDHTMLPASVPRPADPAARAGSHVRADIRVQGY